MDFCVVLFYPYCADGCFSNQSAFQWVQNDLRGYRRVDFAFTTKTGQSDRSVKLAREPFRPELEFLLAGPAGTASRTGRSAGFFFAFFALKGSKLFIIIFYHCSWMLCSVAAVKSLPALIFSADYILLFVL